MEVFVHSVVPQGTVSIGEGITRDGRHVTFAGDWRPMRDLAVAISEGEEPEADVPDWAILSIVPIPCDDCQRTDGTHDLDVEH